MVEERERVVAERERVVAERELILSADHEALADSQTRWAMREYYLRRKYNTAAYDDDDDNARRRRHAERGHVPLNYPDNNNHSAEACHPPPACSHLSSPPLPLHGVGLGVLSGVSSSPETEKDRS